MRSAWKVQVQVQVHYVERTPLGEKVDKIAAAPRFSTK
jgi:hypothetical protein